MPLLSPAEFFGSDPGLEPGPLADWAGLCAYFEHLADQSPRVRPLRLGASGEGRPLLAVLLGSPARLEAWDAGRPPATARAVVARLGGVHAVETCAAQGAAQLAHSLARADGPLGSWPDLVVALVPSLDPDGLDRVVAWRNSGGTGAPPGGWRRHAGHDINRDWILQTEPEVRAVAEHVVGLLRPQVVLDMHEMWTDGPRMFLPPYAPPADPQLDPALPRRAARLGQAIARRLGASGLTGIATGAVFDAFSPARGYPFYHGAVRLLCETAAPQDPGAAPLRVSELRSRGDLDPRQASPRQPHPWPGGLWSARDVRRYQDAATWACLDLVGRRAARWARWQRALEHREQDPGRRPGFFFLAAAAPDQASARETLLALRCGGLAVQAVAGGWRVRRAQRGGRWADALLWPAPYPATPRSLPYDVTAHLLPALSGVPWEWSAQGRQRAPDRSRGPTAGVLPAADLGSYARVFRWLIQGYRVWAIPPGAAPDLPAGGALVRAAGPPDLPAAWRSAARELRAPLAGLYASAAAPDDQGWLRYVLERFGVPHRLWRDQDAAQGTSGATHVLLPALRGRELVHGLDRAGIPAALRAGLGPAGVAGLRRLVRRGARLVAVEDAAAWVEVALELPVSASPPLARDHSTPGTLLAVQPAEGSLGCPRGETLAVMYRGRTVLGDEAETLARFSPGPVVAGLDLGLERVRGSAAAVRTPCGLGVCTLFAFSPYFRAQSWASLRLLFNALLF